MSRYPLTYNAFKDGLKAGRFLGLKCLNCADLTAPPNGVCTSCGSPKLETVDLTPKGKIRTFTVIRVAPIGFKPPYVVALVELDDGPYVLGNLEGVEADKTGLEVIGREVTVGHKFYPLPEGQSGVEGVALTFNLV